MEGAATSASEGKDTGQGEQKQGALSPDLSIYSSCDFYLWCFKVLPCSKRWSHEWTTCPFAHPGEKAKRRDPRTHHYDCEMCPAIVKGEQCDLGTACPHSHHVFESWLHPQKFRTMLCKDGDSCNREVCFFAHGQEQLRIPTRDMALRGPSRPRQGGGPQHRPWTSAAVPAATAVNNSSTATGLGPADTIGNSSGRQVSFHMPLHHGAGQPGGGSMTANVLPGQGGSPSRLPPMPPQQLLRAGSEHLAVKAAGCDSGSSSISVMPVMGTKSTPFNWAASTDRQSSASAALQPQVDPLSSSNMISGSSSCGSSSMSAATAMSMDMPQLLNFMLQQSGNGHSGSLPDLSEEAGAPVGRSGFSRQDSSSMLSGDLAALLLQQQLAHNAAVSQARLQQQPQQQMCSAWGGAGDEGLEQLKLSILQQMQGQLNLQDAVGSAQQTRQSLDNNSISSSSLMLAQSMPSAAALGAAGSMSLSLEQLQTALSGAGVQPGLDLAGVDLGSQGVHSGPSLVPSVSNLGPATAAAGSGRLLNWVQLQQLAASADTSTSGWLLQQQQQQQHQAAAQAAAMQQLQVSAGLGGHDTAWTTGHLANSLGHGATNRGNPTAAAAGGLLLGVDSQANLNRANSGLEQQQQQLASDYLLQLQRNMSGGLGFNSVPDAALLAARSRSSSTLGITGTAAAGGGGTSGRMSLDVAAGYAALLANDGRGPGRVTFDERPMYHSANASLWGPAAEEFQSSGSQLVRTVDAVFPVSYTAAGGSQQLGWL